METKLTVDEFIKHVKISGCLTEENREYIDVRDVQLIIDMITKHIEHSDAGRMEKV